MDPKKAQRRREIESMLRDPQLTPERKAALLSEMASLDVGSEGPAQAKGEAPRGPGARGAASTPVVGALGKWRAGLARASAGMEEGIQMAYRSNWLSEGYHDQGPGRQVGDPLARRTASAKEWAVASAKTMASFGGHAAVAAVVGFAVAGPVGAAILPAFNLMASMSLSTAALMGAAATGSAALRGASEAVGLVEKLRAKRSEGGDQQASAPKAAYKA